MVTLSQRLIPGVFLVIIIGFYSQSVIWVQNHPHKPRPDSIAVAISPSVQIFLAGGDRYLAGNFGMIRAMILSPEELHNHEFEVLAKVQRDVAWLTPGNEDNYYIAQAILPWVGDSKSANYVLDRAQKTRSWDFLPLYFLGFNQMYFDGDFSLAAQTLKRAAARTQGDLHEQLLFLAARYSDRANESNNGIEFVKGLLASAKNPTLKVFLQARINRLYQLKMLREAAQHYRKKYTEPLTSFDQLKSAGLIEEVPVDELGQGFLLDKQGNPQIAHNAYPSLPQIKPRTLP